MTIQNLDFGTGADGDGEFEYTAWPKVQANFEDLYSQVSANAAAIAAAAAAFNESVDDRVAALLVAGSNVTLTYNDVANTLTIAASGGGGSGNAEDIVFTPAGGIVATDVQAALEELDSDIAALSGGSLVDGDYGDIVVSSSGTVWTLDSSVSASLTAFLQSGTGATSRTNQSKLRETGITPGDFGAAGDGVTNDATDYAQAETEAAAQDCPVYLPSGKTFNVSTTDPVEPVFGPGKILVDGFTLGGFYVSYEVMKGCIVSTPPNTDATGYSGGTHSNVLLSTGAVLSGMNRSTAIGSNGPFQVQSWDRIVAIGDQSMRWSRYADRTVAVGTLSYPWLGSNDPDTDLHAWWHNTAFQPGDVGWDEGGMETRNPGIGADIAAYSTWATASTDVGRGVAIGRNAGGAAVFDTDSVYVGYNAGGGVYVGNRNVAVGESSMLNGVFLTECTAVGRESARYWQEGTRNATFGRACAPNVVRGSYNLVLGALAANDQTDLDDSVIIGYGAGNSVSLPADSNDVFIIGNRNQPLLMTGNFTNGSVGVGAVLPASLKGRFHVYTGASGMSAANANADELVIEGSGTSGLSILTPNSAQAQVLFGDQDDANVGGILYTHSSNTMEFRVNDANRIAITSSLMYPVTNDGIALGDTTHNYSDLFLADGSVINWNNGDLTLTHSSNLLTLVGGDLIISSPGTAAGSVCTIDGTQTLTNKTITSPIVNTSLTLGHTAQVATVGVTPALQMHGTSGSTSALGNYRWSNNAGGATSFFNKSRGTAIGTRGVVNSGDALMSLYGAGDDGTNFIEAARIQVIVDGTPGTNDMPGALQFWTTADGASSGTERARINSAGGVFIGDTSDADITIGLTINQGANDNSILTLKSSDVAHGVTTVVETDTYASFKKFAANDGGLQIDALADTGATGLALRGIMVTASTTKSTAGTAAIMVDSALKSGTGVASSGANANMVAFRDNGTTRFILDADGDSHQDVGTAWTNFDFLDDVGTLNSIAYHVARDDDPIKTKFNDWMLTKRERLQELGLVSFGDDGRPFMNMSKLTMLNTGAIRQITEHYEAKLAALESRLAAIEHRGTA